MMWPKTNAPGAGPLSDWLYKLKYERNGTVNIALNL
jgi:hypothetical protein